MSNFNPQDHIRKIGNKDYLDIVWRVKWFRTEYPKNRLDTELLATDGCIIFKATIYHEDGSIWATGHGSAPAFGNGQSTWKTREIEKAETAAIGRALKNIGFGTEYAFDDEDSDGDYLADAPVERTSKSQPPRVVDKPTDNNEQFTAEIKAVDVKLDKHNKPYIVAAGMSFFSRDVFRALDYEDLIIDKLGKVGTVYIDPIRIAFMAEGNAKKPLRVTRLSTGEIINLADLKSKASA